MKTEDIPAFIEALQEFYGPIESEANDSVWSCSMNRGRFKIQVELVTSPVCKIPFLCLDLIPASTKEPEHYSLEVHGSLTAKQAAELAHIMIRKKLEKPHMSHIGEADGSQLQAAQ